MSAQLPIITNHQQQQTAVTTTTTPAPTTTATATTSSKAKFNKRCIEPRDLPFLVETDKEVYPICNVKAHLATEDIMRQWFFAPELIDDQQGAKSGENSRRYRVSNHRDLSSIYGIDMDNSVLNDRHKQQCSKLVNDIAAMCIILPLNERGFKKLSRSEAFETQLDPLHDLFRAKRQPLDSNGNEVGENQGDKKLGLYVLLIDKFVDCVSGLYKMLLQHVASVVDKLRSTLVPDLEVVGFSGYAVSFDGISLFYNKLNCMERPYHVSDEHVLNRERVPQDESQRFQLASHQRDGDTDQDFCYHGLKHVDPDMIRNKKMIVFKTTNLDDISVLLDQGWTYRNRCKYLVTYPGDVSLVWLTIRSKPPVQKVVQKPLEQEPTMKTQQPSSNIAPVEPISAAISIPVAAAASTVDYMKPPPMIMPTHPVVPIATAAATAPPAIMVQNGHHPRATMPLTATSTAAQQHLSHHQRRTGAGTAVHNYHQYHHRPCNMNGGVGGGVTKKLRLSIQLPSSLIKTSTMRQHMPDMVSPTSPSSPIFMEC